MPKINQLNPATSLANTDIMIADTSTGSNTRKIAYSDLRAQVQNESKSVFALKGEIASDDQVADAVGDWLTEHVTPTGSAVAIDDTLKIQGAAADAKAAGEIIVVNGTSGNGTRVNITTTDTDIELAEMSDVNGLKSALQKYNTVDVIAGMIRIPTGSDTVKYAYNDGTLRVWTTAPTTAVVYEVLISRKNIPAYMIPGNTYHVPFTAVKTGTHAGEASNLYFLIGFYNSDGDRTQLDRIENGGSLVTVPSDATQIAITLTVPRGTDIAEAYPDEIAGMEILTAAGAYDMYQPGFTVKSGADLNNIVIRSGFYYLAPGTAYANLPSGTSLTNGGLLEVMRLAPHVVLQRITVLSGRPEKYIRYTNGVSDETFYSWVSE